MLIAAAPTSPLVRSPMERRDCNRRIKVFSGLAKPAITPRCHDLITIPCFDVFRF